MNLKYIISDEMYAKCEKFAQDSVLTSADKYARRNQSNIEKIKAHYEQMTPESRQNFMRLFNKLDSPILSELREQFI